MMRNLLKGRTTKSLRDAVRQTVGEYRMSRRHLASARKARRAALGTGLRLHLGCGPNLKPGWINVDLFSDQADFQLDLREPLPFPNGSAQMIYSEHFFEHVEYPGEVHPFLAECLRVLQPGGVFSVGVPDAEVTLRAYAAGDEAFFRMSRERWHPSSCNTPMHSVNYLFRQGREHKYAYDFLTLARVLEESGFQSVQRRAFDPALDSEFRRDGTLYVDGRKAIMTSATSSAEPSSA